MGSDGSDGRCCAWRCKKRCSHQSHSDIKDVATLAALFEVDSNYGRWQEPVLVVELNEAKDYLGGIETRLTREGLTVTTDVRQGRVAREVIAAAQPSDVIVMASHGRGGLSRWLLGSVAEDVVRHATVPVLLVHAGAEPVPSEAAHAPAMATAR